MDTLITNPVTKDFFIEQLTLKNPQMINNSTQCKIKYNNQKLLLQTPLCIISKIPEIKSYTRNIKLKLITTDYTYNVKTKVFVKTLQLIDRFIKKKYKQLSNTVKSQNNIFVKSYYKNIQNTNVFFNHNIQTYNNKPVVDIYNYENILQDFDFIIPDSECYCLIWLKNMWINNDKYGLNWEIIQIKVFQPIYTLPECFINDNTTNYITNINCNFIKYKDHPLYCKFFKMKKMGVHSEAIKNLMKLENLSSNILDYPDKICEDKQKGKGKGKCIPPPPPPLNNTDIKNIPSINLMNVLKDLTSIKLKKNDNIVHKPLVSNNIKVPTLSEIINSKNNLKKII